MNKHRGNLCSNFFIISKVTGNEGLNLFLFPFGFWL